MNNEEVQEWFEIADSDLDSAKILNEAVRKHHEIICYHCAQAVEKYLKGYLVFNDIIPEKTHNLVRLNTKCIEFDNDFQNIHRTCGILDKYATDIRYQKKYDVTEADTTLAITAVEKIKNFKPIVDLRLIVATDC